jgi:hypothetical protein
MDFSISISGRSTAEDDIFYFAGKDGEQSKRIEENRIE